MLQYSKLHNKNGLTLTELIVSTILIGIVIVGVGAFSLAIKQIQDTTNKQTILSMRTTSFMKQFVDDVNLAVGHGPLLGANAAGISIDTTAPTYHMCLRHDADNNPNNYGGDEWVCYFHDADNVIRVCRGITTGATAPTTAVFEDADGGNECNFTLMPFQLQLSGAGFFTVNVDVNNRIQYIELDLNTLYDASLPTGDNMVNPEFQLRTVVSPVMHTR